MTDLPTRAARLAAAARGWPAMLALLLVVVLVDRSIEHHRPLPALQPDVQQVQDELLDLVQCRASPTR